MTAAYKAQFKAQTAAQENAKPAYGTSVPPDAVRGTGAKETGGREGTKEQPGPKADATVRYAFAGPLHAEQFPGEFRCTITGPLDMKPELIAALLELARLAKEQFIDPAP